MNATEMLKAQATECLEPVLVVWNSSGGTLAACMFAEHWIGALKVQPRFESTW